MDITILWFGWLEMMKNETLKVMILWWIKREESVHK